MLNHSFCLIFVVLTLVSMTPDGPCVLGILAILLLALLTTFSNQLYLNKFWVTTANLLYVISVCVHILGKLALAKRKALGRNFAEISFIVQLYYFIHQHYPSVPIYFNFTWTICFISKLAYYGFFFVVITNKRDEPVKRLKLKPNPNCVPG